MPMVRVSNGGTGIGAVLETKSFTVGAGGAGASGSTAVALNESYQNAMYALRLTSPRSDVAAWVNSVSGNIVTISCTTYYAGYKSVSGDLVVYEIQ